MSIKEKWGCWNLEQPQALDNVKWDQTLNLVNTTSTSTNWLLSMEVQQFIASCDMFEANQWEFTLSADLTVQIKKAVKASKSLTETWVKMEELYTQVSWYAEQMKKLLERQSGEKEKTLERGNKWFNLPFNMGKIQDSIAKMPPTQRAIWWAIVWASTFFTGLWVFAIPLVLAWWWAGFFYDRLFSVWAHWEDVFSELEEGWLTELAQQIETALNNVTTQYESLQKAKKVFEQILQEARDKLEKVNNFLATNIWENERTKLEKIRQDLEQYIPLLEAQLKNVDTAIEYYQASVMQLIQDAPKPYHIYQ
jgi:tetratricopeptide (TPR) repeat protein